MFSSSYFLILARAKGPTGWNHACRHYLCYLPNVDKVKDKHTSDQTTERSQQMNQGNLKKEISMLHRNYWIVDEIPLCVMIGGPFRELPRYIAATQDVVIECGGKKVEWWRVHEKRLPNWSSCCPLLWLFLTSLVPDFLSLGHGVTKPKLKNSQRITVLSKLENFYGALFSGKQRISWAKILIGSLSTWLFWATDGNRKSAVFLFNLPLQHHIYIFECIFTSRDD